MQIKVTTRHGHLTEEKQEKIVAKAEKLLRFFDRLTSIEVVVDLKESHALGVQINATLEHMHEFVAHDQSDNLLTAIESTVHKMEQQLKRHKDRLQHRNRDASAKRATKADPEAASSEAEAGSEE